MGGSTIVNLGNGFFEFKREGEKVITGPRLRIIKYMMNSGFDLKEIRDGFVSIDSGNKTAHYGYQGRWLF